MKWNLALMMLRKCFRFLMFSIGIIAGLLPVASGGRPLICIKNENILREVTYPAFGEHYMTAAYLNITFLMKKNWKRMGY
jgi:hypothetical protein